MEQVDGPQTDVPAPIQRDMPVTSARFTSSVAWIDLEDRDVAHGGQTVRATVEASAEQNDLFRAVDQGLGGPSSMTRVRNTTFPPRCPDGNPLRSMERSMALLTGGIAANVASKRSPKNRAA